VPAPPPALIDFGRVQLGGAATQRVSLPALGLTASGAGFSAARTAGGILIVFEPYELREPATGSVRVRTRGGVVRIRLRGRGIDTIRPSVTVATPHGVHAGSVVTIRFEASDNDLVRACTLRVGGRVIARLRYPASAYRWRVPSGLRARERIKVVAVDRAGNRRAATSGAFAVRQ
jgi:hypothetical protein